MLLVASAASAAQEVLPASPSAEVTASEDQSEQTGDRHVALSVTGETGTAASSLADTAAQEPARRQQPPSDGQQATAGGGGGKPVPVAAAPAPAAAPTPQHQQLQPQKPQPQQRMAAPPRFCPPHGAKAICGRRARMEDAYTAVPFLLEVRKRNTQSVSTAC